MPRLRTHISPAFCLSLLCLLLSGILSACTAPATTPTAAPPAATITGETRLIQHAMGETAVPIDPQRVVVLDTGELDAALALGVKPVGSVTRFDDGLFPDYLAAQAQGIEAVGTIGTPNLEKMVALQPDLILSNQSRDEERYDLLTAIAPTIFAERIGPVWKENFQLYANALNKAAEAEAVVAAYDARLVDLRAALGDEELTISMVRFVDGQVRVYHPGSFIGVILADAGLQRPATQQNPDEVWSELSQELIPQLDADVIFYGVYGDPAGTPLDIFLNDPLWAQLRAVQTGRVFAVPDEYWYAGLGFLAANRVIDDLFTHLAPEAATTAETTTASATRVYAHALGESEIPTNPQRIVVLDAVDNLLALGVQPVGGAQWVGTASGIAASWPSYIDPAMVEEITFLGPTNTPNLEQIALLNPDLIIGRINFHEEIYPQLREIAPTVILDIKNSGQWRAEFFAYADLVGRTAEAEALMAAYESRAAAIAERLAALDTAPEVSLVRIDPERIVMYQKSLFIGQVLSDAGVKRPATQDVDNSSEQLSLETISQLDADVIFVIESNPAEAKYQAIVDTPLWNQLRAVQNGRVYAVPFDLWIGGWTINGAHAVLDQLETYLLAESGQ